jgi:hypothetical protein
MKFIHDDGVDHEAADAKDWEDARRRLGAGVRPWEEFKEIRRSQRDYEERKLFYTYFSQLSPRNQWKVRLYLSLPYCVITALVVIVLINLGW